MTPRVRELRRRARRRRGCFWRRRRWVAESLAQTVGQPVVVRQALALAHVLRRMPVRVAPGELIVGHHPESVPPRDAPPWPFLGPNQDSLRLPEERLALRAGLFTSGAKTGHLTADYPTLLAEGFSGVLAKVQARLATASAGSAPELEAMAVALRGTSALVRRYARLTARLARQARTRARACELRNSARVCLKVADRPPATFQEALQLLWFAFLTQCLEEGESTAAFALGRFDQYLYPFWAADLAAGHSRGALMELLACFWVKLNEFSGLQVLNLTIGGSDREGRDATNSLSFACLELMADMRGPTPSLSVRWHPRLDPVFFRQALRLGISGIGQPAFYGDPAAIRTMRQAGVAEADAVEVVPGGCVELGIQGCCYPWVGNFFNLAKCLELALHDGVDPATGQRLGPAAGTPAALTDFESLVGAYERQVMYFLDLMARSENTTDSLAAAYRPYPFLSALVADCIERGKDITAGGARYNFTEVQGVGIATVVDSLLNLRQLVYERREVDLPGLVAILDRGFAEAEPLRRRLAGLATGYGSGSAEAAAMARRVVHGFYAGVEGRENPRGGRFHPGLLVWTLYDAWADCVGALPDGRRRGDTLTSSIGPRDYAHTGSPTAIIRDVTSFDHSRCVGGLTFNLRFDAGSVQTDAGFESLQRLLETYFSEGGLQVQLNVVDAATLRAAQQDPAAYRDLTVRVSGFSARFVDLSCRIQDEILQRAALVPG